MLVPSDLSSTVLNVAVDEWTGGVIKLPNQADYTQPNAWTGSSVEYITWIAEAGNVSLIFRPWSQELTKASFRWPALLEMTMNAINGTDVPIDNFFVSQWRLERVTFAGMLICDRVTEWLYVVIPDAVYEESLKFVNWGKVFHAFRVLNPLIWLLLFASLFVISLLVFFALKLAPKKEKPVPLELVMEQLFKNLLNSDSNLFLKNTTTGSSLFFGWSVLCFVFIAVYTGCVMSLTTTVAPIVPEATDLDG